MKYIVFIIFLTFFFSPMRVYAQVTPTCQPIYGGGPSCATPTPTNQNTTATPTSVPLMQQPTTKQTTQVFPQPGSKKTPASGPESISILGLIPAAILGWKLRKVTKRTS